MTRETPTVLYSLGAGSGLARRAAVVFVLVMTVSYGLVGAVTATDTTRTSIQVDASAPRVGVSETTTVDVVVRNVDGGVGAFEFVVGLSNSSVATVTDVELVGDPGLQTVDVAANGSRAELKAALLDTADTGNVTVASVTVAGVSPGTTDVSVSVSALGNENGSRYPVEGHSATVTVASDSGSDTVTADDSFGSADESTPVIASAGETTGESDMDPDGDALEAAAPDDSDAPGGDAASEESVSVGWILSAVDRVPMWAAGALLVALALLSIGALLAVRRVR